ncbi:MAG: hypothetical protein JXQ87_08275 [Bacteroidia bacterium]
MTKEKNKVQKDKLDSTKATRINEQWELQKSALEKIGNSIKKTSVILWLITFSFITNAQTTYLYVDVNATGSNNGSSWANAYVDLQDALDAHMTSNVDEILVAEGTYFPTASPTPPWCCVARSFFLKNADVIIKGGYDPSNGTKTGANTILSGDVGIIKNNSDNLFHVFITSGLSRAAVFDNLVIEHGNARGSGYIRFNGKNFYMNDGGGMSHYDSNPTIKNCIFRKNLSTDDGAGVYSYNSDVRYENCLFMDNAANSSGGGLYNSTNCESEIINCSFIANTASSSGGGPARFYKSSNPLIINSLFFKNSGDVSLSTSSLASGSSYNASDIGTTSKVNVGSGFKSLTTSNSNFINYANIKGTDGIRMTEDDGLILHNSSNAYAAGTSNYAPPTDITGRTRGSTPSIGAFEAQLCNFVTRLFVKHGATGDGTSWSNAMGNLQDAINCADVGDEIWVAKGTYKPSIIPYTGVYSSISRDLSFYIDKDIKVYGGFDGTETTLSQRDLVNNQVILSGAINTSATTDNCRHVLITANLTTSAIIDGFYIQDGYANGSVYNTFSNQDFYEHSGGGIYNVKSKIRVNNIVVRNNTASNGAGVKNTNSNTAFQNVIIEDNSANDGNGGGMSFEHSQVSLVNVQVINNNASASGGGIYFHDDKSDSYFEKVIIKDNEAANGGGFYSTWASTKFVNSIITNNTANVKGGGVYVGYVSNPSFTNVNILNNHAKITGGGFYINSNSALITVGIKSCIIWNNTLGNTPRSNAIGADIHIISPSVTSATYSILQLANTSYSSTNNNKLTSQTKNKYNENPLFIDNIDLDGPDNKWMTLDDGLILSKTSPAIASGTSSGTPTKDISGRTRPSSPGAPAIGAYESYLCNYISRFYVKPGGTGIGTSWSDAADLQSALSCADPSDEIWVAKGTYTPTIIPSSGVSSTSSRNLAFYINNDIKVYGGFSGSETALSQRNPEVNATILSGEIGSSGNADNCYHVLITEGLSANAIIDGFSIKDGNANGSGSVTINGKSFASSFAGGVFNGHKSSPTLKNLNISSNYGKNGGGVYNFDESNPKIINCKFYNNSAESGGAFFNYYCSPIIINTLIVENSASRYGGGIFNNFQSSPKITNATISNNTALISGGGGYNDKYSEPIYKNTIFWANKITVQGTDKMKGSDILNVNSSKTHANNCLMQLSSSTYTTTNANLLSTSSNNLYELNPLLLSNADAYYRLRKNSPVINAGNNTDWTATGLGSDMVGNTRPLDVTVDMGAVEGGYNGIIFNNGLLEYKYDELTLSSSMAAGMALQSSGDKIEFFSEGDFIENSNDLPSNSNVFKRFERSWKLLITDIGSNGGELNMNFNLGQQANPNYSYYLLKRSGTSGNFTAVNNLNYKLSGSEVIFTLDLSELENNYYYTLGRSDEGAGNCLDFRAWSSDYVILDEISDDIAGKNTTFEGWFASENNNNKVMFSIHTGTGVNKFILYRNMTYVTGKGYTGWSSFTPNNKWHHYAVVLEHGTKYSIYIDGELQSSFTTAHTLTSTDLFSLGQEWDGGTASDFMNGKVDEFRVWDDIRTQDEIKKNMYRTLAGNESNLVAYYKFDQASETYLPDVSQNNNQGTIVGFSLTGTNSNWVESTAPVMGKEKSKNLLGPGNCLDFDGTDDYVDLSALSSDLAGKDFTFEAWVNNTTVSTAKEAIFCINTSKGGNQILLFNDHVWEENLSTGKRFSLPISLADNKWHHVALVLESGESYKFYVDGYLIYTKTSSGNITVVNSNDKISLGIDYDSGLSKGDYWKGKIDDVRIWSSLRTQTEIQDNMYASLEGDETNLLAYYDFNHTTGTTLSDKTSNGNNGTLNSFTGTYWVSAADREPFKTVRPGTHSTTSTWKEGTAPSSNTDRIAVFHDLTISSTGTYERLHVNSGNTLTTNANVTITGDVVVNGNTSGNNKIILGGTSGQIIGGSGTIGDLEVNNANDVDLEGDLTLNGALTLTNGDIEINDNTLTLTGTTSHGSSSSYIKLNGTGNVKTTVGSSPVILPIGRNPYLPIILDDGGDAEYTVGVSDKVYDNPTNPISEITSNVVSETWTIQASSAVNNVTVQLGWNASEEIAFARANSGIAYWENGISSAWQQPTDVSAATGSDPYFQTRTMDFSTNLYYLGVGDKSSPLPVDFTYFNAQWQTKGETAILNWQTAMEENNSHFEIERSFDGQVWEQIGAVAGQGTTFDITDYQFVDQLEAHNSKLAAKLYYRLKQVDYNGDFDYSPIETLNFELETRNTFKVWPNPTYGDVIFTNIISDYEIYSLSGRLLKSFENCSQLKINDLKKGTYIIKSLNGQTTMFVKN